MASDKDRHATLAGWGIICLAVVLRFYGLTEQALTNDEVIEVEDAVLSTWSQILWCPDAFPPLYRVLLAGWESVFGAGVQGRWLSLLWGVAFVPATMATSFVMTESRSAALWTGFLAAINPLMIHYSQELRAYMLYVCVAAWVMYCYVRCIKFNRTGDWIWFAVLSLVGCYSHYYFALLLLALGSVWLASAWRQADLWRGGLLATSILIVGILPLISFFIPDFFDTVGYPIKSPFSFLAAGYTYYAFVAGFCVGPSRAELHELDAYRLIGEFVPSLLLLGVLVSLCVWYAMRVLRKKPRWFWTLLSASLLPTVIAALVSSVTDLRFGVRYVAISAVPILCALGIGIACMTSQKLRFAVALGFLLVTGISTYQRHFVPIYKNEDLQSLAMELEEREPGTVFLLADYTKRPLGYYLGHQQGFVPLPVPEKTAESIDDEEELSEVIERIEQANPMRPIWIVLSRAYHGDPHYLFREWLSRSSQVRLVREFDGAWLYQYRSPSEVQ